LSQFQSFGIAHGVPELEDVDRPFILVDGIDDPVLGAAADTEQVGPVGRAGEGE
jgi:hypothetical protein